MNKFRCSNVKFPIETGRWANIPHLERICRCCQVHIGKNDPQISALVELFI
jgi:hypothetical protein